MAAVVIVAYDPTWPDQFEQLAAALARQLSDVLAIDHIGSTAVPAWPPRTSSTSRAPWGAWPTPTGWLRNSAGRLHGHLYHHLDPAAARRPQRSGDHPR
jgi:hypothetical protein